MSSPFDHLSIIQTNDGSASIYNSILDETYHSRHGAIQESQYVYISQGLDIIEKTENEITIFEMGFGTGSNLLLTIEYLMANPTTKVSYITIEKYPLPLETILQLNYQSHCQSSFGYQTFLKAHEVEWNAPLVSILPNLNFQKWNEDINVFKTTSKFDLIYFDAFAPSKQIEVWDVQILKNIYNFMKIGGILVTYCSQGQFKRNLKSIGFEVITLQGPPHKKEMIRAIKR